MSPTARISAASFRATHAKGAPKQGRVRGVAPAEERRFNGRTFHSKAERVLAERLELWKRAGIIESWQAQFPFELRAEGGEIVGRLMVDFAVRFVADSICAFFEVKPPYSKVRGMIRGGTTDLAVWKLKHFRAQYPERRLIVLSLRKGRFSCWPDTSLEDLAALAQAGLVLE